MIRAVACAVPNRHPGDPKLVGGAAIRIEPQSLLSQIYGSERAVEEYFCNYEVNGDYLEPLAVAGLRFTAWGEEGELRAIEIPENRFFLATLFQPQLAAQQPHPVLVSYVRACAENSRA